MKTKILTHRAPWRDVVELMVTRYDGTRHQYAANIEFKEMDGVVVDMEPTLSLSYEDAQSLMDGLWDCGLRPSEGAGSAGALAATQKHLEDMRRLVFSKEDK